MAMLTMMTKMRLRTGSQGMGLIAREAALDVTDGLYEPPVVEQIPGVANLLAACSAAGAIRRPRRLGLCRLLSRAL